MLQHCILCSREVEDANLKKKKKKKFYLKLVEVQHSQRSSNRRKYFQKHWFPLLGSGVLVSWWISANVFHGSSVLLVESEPRSMVMQSTKFYSIFCLFQLKYPSVRLRRERMHVRILRGAHILCTHTHMYSYTAVKPSFVSLSILPFLDCLIETCFLSCQPLLQREGRCLWRRDRKRKREEGWGGHGRRKSSGGGGGGGKERKVKRERERGEKKGKHAGSGSE